MDLFCFFSEDAHWLLSKMQASSPGAPSADKANGIESGIGI